MRTKKYTAEQYAEVTRLRREGKGLKDIVALTGMPIGFVRGWVTPSRAHRQGASGVVLSKGQRIANLQKYTPELEERIVALRQEGKSHKEIALLLAVKRSKVISVCFAKEITVSKEVRTRNTRAGRNGFLEIHASTMPAHAQLHGGKFLGPYKGALIKSLWTCDKDHEFLMRPNDVLSGHWCPRCANVGPSSGQLEVLEFVRSIVSDAVLCDREVIKPFELDIWVPSRRLAIEYCGLYWHGEVRRPKGAYRRHSDKWQLCRSQNIRLITIFEDEWLFRQDQVKGFLAATLGQRGTQLGARECRVQQVEDQPAREFLDLHHIQGAVRGDSWGLYHNDELASLVTMQPLTGTRVPPGLQDCGPRAVQNMVRYCVKTGTGVVGGLSKLLASYKDAYPEVRGIVTYADNRWSQGGVYKASGFLEAGTSKPTYSYFKASSRGPREHRFKYRKDNLHRLFPGIPNDTTEWEFMQAREYDRIWDCGHTKWVLTLP